MCTMGPPLADDQNSFHETLSVRRLVTFSIYLYFVPSDNQNLPVRIYITDLLCKIEFK
jgi:hypothetical protein